DYKLLGGCSVDQNTLTVTPEGCAPAVNFYGSRTLPVLASTTDTRGSVFNVNAGDLGLGTTEFLYFDPTIVAGYDFQIFSGPFFHSFLLPAIGSSEYEVWLFDPRLDKYMFDGDAFADIPFDFGPAGVDRFRLTGIGPADPAAFVIGLTFVDAGA